jgi:hypothetical protein
MVSFPQVSPLKPCMHLSSPHTCHMSCPSQSSWLDHPNDIWFERFIKYRNLSSSSYHHHHHHHYHHHHHHHIELSLTNVVTFTTICNSFLKDKLCRLWLRVERKVFANLATCNMSKSWSKNAGLFFATWRCSHWLRLGEIPHFMKL